MDIVDRLIEIREDKGYSQEKFALELGLSRNFINQVENRKKNISDRTISDICREFDVNENWLRNGNGEMKKPRTRNQEVFAFANDVMELSDDKFKKRFVEALTRLDQKDWEALEIIAEKLLKEG